MRYNKFLFTIVMALMIIVSACKKSVTSVTPVQTSSVANTATSTSMAKSTDRPFKGSMTYVLSTTLSLPCSCGSLATVGCFNGTGNVTHLGSLTSTNKTCVAPIIVNGNYIGNHIVISCGSFTAANGDEIAVNIHPYDVMFNPTTGLATGTLTADFTNGGTGRFVYATGGFTGTITISLTNPNIAMLTNIDGSIGY